jgi:hypothetical protein
MGRSRLSVFALLVSLLLALHTSTAHAQETTPPTPTTPRLTVQGASVNVRSGPGLAYAVIGKATKGQQFTITGRDAKSTWWQVDFKGKPGWLAAALVKVPPEAAGVKVAENIPPPPGKAAPAAATAAPSTTPIGPSLPPYQDAITLGEGTTYPVRARSIKGWGYELVDETKDYDIVVNRDVFGAFINQMWPDLLTKHPKGMRITFRDPAPKQNYAAQHNGFGDGESAWVGDIYCDVQHKDDNGTIWQNDLVDCTIALVAPGPGLTDLAITAMVLGYGESMGDRFWAAFDRPVFAPLGKATRDVDTGQWRWGDPFIQVASLNPMPAPVAAAPAVPKGPLPPPSGQIVFTRGRDNNGPTPAGVSDIAVVDVKTGQTQVLAQNGRQPDVRNDGRIVFNGEGSGRDDLQVIEPDGSGLRPISKHPEDSAPRWSDDGRKLAFHSMLAGVNDRLFIQENSEVQEEPMHLQYGDSPLYGRYPFWTSDGLGYSGCIGGNCGIWVTGLKWAPKITQTFKRQLTTLPEDRASDIHADMVLLASPKSGNWDLDVIPAAGGKARNLTNSPSQDLGGSYSPEGNYIAFMSDRGGGWGIWIMEADGANPRHLVAVPEGFGKLWDQDRVSWGP